uniref:Putative tick transposon n=1 Tax=Ixodes scapularis TaxID=6945 RepID=A0A4D5RD20_IXOSC
MNRAVCLLCSFLVSLCAAFHHVGGGTNREKTNCKVSHETKHTECEREVVYRVPLSCGRCYIGQTGRCIGDQTREHAASVKATTAAGDLPAHCHVCRCVPEFSGLTILARGRRGFARGVLEALAVDAGADECVCVPSIALHSREVEYLGGPHLWRTGGGWEDAWV